jgi:hypothetical protein
VLATGYEGKVVGRIESIGLRTSNHHVWAKDADRRDANS